MLKCIVLIVLLAVNCTCAKPTTKYVNTVDITTQHSVLDQLFSFGTNHLFSVGKDTILMWLSHFNDRLSYRTTYPFSSIRLSGAYQLASKVNNSIVIAASDVTLDLNGNTVAGSITINSGLSKVTIKNGVVSTTAADGISVGIDCTNISIIDVTVKNATRGINCNRVTDSMIKNCEMTLNVTGLELNTCRNIMVQDCIASRNTFTGFGLISTTTCTLLGCKALSTGDGNTRITNNVVVGFVAQNGLGNIFDNCIANATQALTTTDYNSIVAGFALRGSENRTSIINCEASGAQTNFTGVTIPYGIVLEASLTTLTSVTVVNPEGAGGINDEVVSLDWSPDGQYLAIGGVLYSATTNRDLIIYRFDRSTGALTALTAVNPEGGVDTDSVKAVNWSPDGRYLAVAGIITGFPFSNDVFVYRFDRISETLIPVASANPDGTGSDNIFSVDWSSDGLYLAVGGTVTGSPTSRGLIVYKFNSVAETLTRVASGSTEGASAETRSVEWSPDNQYLAIGGNLYGSPGNDLIVYQFDRSTGTLGVVASANVGATTDTVFSVNWSPDGLYLAVGGTISGNDVIVYRFNRAASSLTSVVSVDPSGSGLDRVRWVNWSPDGQYLAVGGRLNYLTTGNDLVVYRFDRGAATLTQIASVNPEGVSDDDTVDVVRWSPDGRYLAVGGALYNTADLIIYSAIQFPSNNVINNNVTYANSGGNLPYGVGISGSSIENAMTGNTSFQNPNNPFMAYSNYVFVANVYNQLFGHAPTLMQNMQGAATVPILTPDDFDTRLIRSLSKAADIQTKVDILIQKSPLTT